MAKRRRTANPMFQQPLTTAETEGKQVTKAMPKYLTCRLCGLSGGTLVKIGDGIYECQDKGKCNIMQFKRKRGRGI